MPSSTRRTSQSTASLAVSFPSGVFPIVGSYLYRKIPASGYVPSQRFSRSQGLFPPATCQPCFMLVPPLGFLPSGSISTRRAVHPLGCRYPPGVHILVEQPSRPSWLRRVSGYLGIHASFTETVLFPVCSSSGPCSLRVSTAPGQLFKAARICDPPGFSPPWGFLLFCR